MIELKNISKSYKTKAGAVPALKNIDLKFDKSGLVFVVGKSGSGKSTLLNLLGAIDTPDSGELIIDQQTTSGFKQSDYDAYRNFKVGFVFQEYNLLNELNVRENISLALELQGLEKNTEKIEKVLADVDLSEYIDRKVSTLSGGQKQRVAIARALVKNPSIILADEPTGALDSETGQDFYILLKKLSEKRLVIVVSHDIVAAVEFGDRVIELKDGKVFTDNFTTQKSETIDEDKIERNSETGGNLTTDPKIKKGLSFNYTFKLGSKIFISKKIRLAVSVLLCAIAFLGLSLSINIATYDKAKTTVRSLKGNTDYISYRKEIQNSEGYWSWYSDESYFSNSEIAEIQGQLGRNIVGMVPFNDNGSSTYAWHEINKNSESLGTTDYTGINGAAFLSGKMIEEAGFKVYGRMPIGDDEVAVTDYAYQLYKKAGYDSSQYYGGRYLEGTQKKINSREDLFGQVIKVSFRNDGFNRYLTICGVVDTNFNYDKYNDIDEKEDVEKSHLKSEFNAEMETSWHSLVFLSEKLIGQAGGGYSHVLAVCSDNNKDLEKFSALASNEKDGVRYTLANYISQRIAYADSVFVTVKKVALYAGLVISVFAVILLANYISATTSDNKKTVGIIRALGGGSKETIKIFIVQSLLVALCVFVLTLIFSLIGIEIIGAMTESMLDIPIKLFYFDISQLLIILGLSVVSAVIASLVPVYLMTKKKPIDVIRT